MIRTQIQITEDQALKLKRLSTDSKKSIAALIRDGIDLVTKAGAVPDSTELKQRALAASGRFASGVTDLSERHDEYAADAYR